MVGPSFRECVNHQVDILREGKPLEAFDRFFSPDGVMYANDEVFAKGAKEARRKQEPFIAAAKSISGSIVDVIIMDDHEVCIFKNQTSFITSDDVEHKIDGLCWQKWRDGQIIEERYYDGDLMQSLLAEGILLRPEMLISGS